MFSFESKYRRLYAIGKWVAFVSFGLSIVWVFVLGHIISNIVNPQNNIIMWAVIVFVPDALLMLIAYGGYKLSVYSEKMKKLKMKEILK